MLFIYVSIKNINYFKYIINMHIYIYIYIKFTIFFPHCYIRLLLSLPLSSHKADPQKKTTPAYSVSLTPSIILNHSLVVLSYQCLFL